MNSESNSKSQRTPAGKAASYKRVHRANRPTLVTAEAAQPTRETIEIEEASQPETQIAVEERPTEQPAQRRRMPAFFTSIGRGNRETPEADPKAARMARAMRGKTLNSAKEEIAPAKKSANGTAKATVTPTRPRSKFKMRYLWGMMIYVLIAEYLGTFVTAYMKGQHMDGVVVPLGSFQLTRSTLVFLAILVVILIVMARFDLIPTSMTKMMGDSAAPRGTATTSKKDAPTFETRAPQPTIRQGVKGEHDSLYQEYRSNQRYFQKRDRKR